MDNFFKAAVCDLDKLLDDFELNTDEHIYRSVSLSPPAYPGHSLGPQGFLPETSTVPVPHSLLDLNSLHYGTAPSCPDCPSPSPGDREAKGRPLTGVDLLSSVDGRGAAKSCAPPFPKRALKPVCDLVSDTGSAHLLLRANSHDAFSELDVVERRLEEELLVDFTSPVVALPEDSIAGLGPGHGRTEGREALAGGGEGLLGLDSGGYSASLSLLDVILPAAVERAPSLRNSESGETEEERDRGGEATEVAFVNQHLKITPAHQDQASVSPVAIDTKKEDTPTCDIDIEAREEGEGSLEPSELTEAESSGSCTGQAPNPEDGSGGVAESPSTETELSLSCLPMGVSMCGALVASKNPEEAMGGGEGEAGLTETLEAESLSAFEVQEEVTLPENPETVGDCTNPDAAPENKPVQSPNTQSPETTTMPFHLAVSAPAVSQRPLKVSFSLVEKQPVPGAPQCPASSPSEPSPNPMDPPGFGFEYLPESDQARLLVTDEELDAFLRGETQGQEDHGVPDCGRPGENLQDEGFSELNGNLEERLVEEELRSCSRSLGEGLERLPSRESDRTLSAEGNVSRALSAPSQDPPSPYHTDPSTCSLSNLPPPYYGGARPKQLHCQAPRAPPAAGEDQGPSSPTDRTDTGEEVDQSPSPPSPNPAEDPSNQGVPCPGYSPPECYVSSVGYDELSEPPPYPGEPAGEGSGSSEGREAEDEEGLGCKQPPWVPDSEAPNCMNCWQKFTFTRRRHHCRACGKVYCAICCNRRCKLKYLDKEARVCVVCFETVHRSKTQAQALECMRSPPGPSPNPNVPSEYCSTIPPLQQARAAGTLNSPPPTVMVPVSVLKNPGSDDGILPNGEVANTTRLSVTGRRGSQESSPVTPDPPTAGSRVSPGSAAVSEGGVSAPVEVVRPPVSGPWDYSLLCGVGGCVERSPSLLPEDEEGLPPLLITTGEEEGGGDLLVEERPAPCQILLLLEEGGPRPLTFVLNANLLVNVKLVTYCSRKCWCMGSSGLQTVGQREIVFILEVLPEERALPKDLFTLYLSIYQDAQRGTIHTHTHTHSTSPSTRTHREVPYIHTHTHYLSIYQDAQRGTIHTHTLYLSIYQDAQRGTIHTHTHTHSTSPSTRTHREVPHIHTHTHSTSPSTRTHREVPYTHTHTHTHTTSPSTRTHREVPHIHTHTHTLPLHLPGRTERYHTHTHTHSTSPSTRTHREVPYTHTHSTSPSTRTHREVPHIHTHTHSTSPSTRTHREVPHTHTHTHSTSPSTRTHREVPHIHTHTHSTSPSTRTHREVPHTHTHTHTHSTSPSTRTHREVPHIHTHTLYLSIYQDAQRGTTHTHTHTHSTSPSTRTHREVPHIHTHTHSTSPSTRTHREVPYTHTHTHTLPLHLPGRTERYHTYTHTHTLYLSIYQDAQRGTTHTHTHTLYLSIYQDAQRGTTHTHTHTLYLSIYQDAQRGTTHTHTHTHSTSPSTRTHREVPHIHTHTHSTSPSTRTHREVPYTHTHTHTLPLHLPGRTERYHTHTHTHTLYLSIYQDAQRGKYVEELGNVAFTGSFLGSKEHGGVLFYSPTFQPLEGLCLPPQPFLCGLLIQRLEVPWAKVFPLRLLLRLGAEHSVYPSTLVSVRFRETVFRETGHTIMNLLADLRNYQYSLPAVEGLRIHMEMGHSYINIPKSSFPEMLKVVNASNEHVISVGAGFSSEADSHLVCFQNKEGTYQTQANSQPGKTRTVTGASFVVFNGALKASSGFIAKSSIVEDGLMVQTPPETMEALRAALRGQTDFHIPCGKADGGELRDNVTVRWIDWSSPVNAGVTSGVDRKPLEGVHSVRMQQDTEFESDGRTIRCTEVFYWLKTPDVSLSAVLPSCSVFHREMAVASCSALTPHLSVLSASGINSLALRVSTHTDMVEYQAGSGGRLLPQRYMNELDSALIPVIHGGSARVPQTAMDMEFIFYITHTQSRTWKHKNF
eukprot:XP_013996083.1 PREDICTED: zinc finger FYVE domain-containing protein 16-like isoform X3 [Salmo salar]